MKRLLFIICALMALAASSCIEDGFTTSSSDLLKFSTDTVSFDTVFTDENTSTRRFLVYNPHKKQLNIEHIYMSDSPEGAQFFLNVDGRSGEEFRDIEVRGQDSIYVFVKAQVNANEENLPFDVFGHLNFVTNGVTQTVVLRAAGQNAYTIRDWHITENTTLATDRPYRIMDSIVVEEGATLTIPPGLTVFFHDKGRIKVRGTLKAIGEQALPITMRADRLDQVAGDIPFDLMAGQWDGILLERQSFDNEMAYVVMRGSSTGVTADSCGVLDRRKLHLFNSVLHNSSSSVLTSSHSWIDAEGCEFSDANNGVVTLTGGRHAFNNCTFANYYLFDAITSAIVTIGYVLPDEQIYDNPLMEAVFNNCIIYGNTSDISHGDLAGSNVKLQHCLLRSKGEDDNNFIACTWGGDPKFYTVREEYVFDYRLKDESDAIGKGNTALCPENARYDRFGNDRMQASGLDLGAYVYIPEPKEEQQ